MSVGTSSSKNSSTTPIGGGETFTGEWETVADESILISSQSDVAGTIFFDFSNDGGINTTTFPVAGFAAAAGIHEFHTALKGARSFRIRYVNGAAAQSYLRLYVYYGLFAKDPNSPVSQSFGADADAVLVRTTSDHNLDLVRGFVGGQSAVHKFGANPSISASSTEDIIFSGIINWLTVATTVRVKAGGNVADVDTTGAGARTITVLGLDENWAEAQEDIALVGDTESAVTNTTFIRVYRAYVKTVGTYTGANTGNIVLEIGAGGTDLLTIVAGDGQTEISSFTIPAGKTGYLTRVAATVDSGKAVTMRMWQRQDADDVAAPFTGKRLITTFPQLIGADSAAFDSYITFPAMTDLWWTGTTGSGNTAAVEVDYDLILVDD